MKHCVGKYLFVFCVTGSRIRNDDFAPCFSRIHVVFSGLPFRDKDEQFLSLNSFVYKTKLIFIRIINSIFYVICVFDRARGWFHSLLRILSVWLPFFTRQVMAHMRGIFASKKCFPGERFKFNNKFSPSFCVLFIYVLHKHLMKKFHEIISPFFGFEPSERGKNGNENDSHR